MHIALKHFPLGDRMVEVGDPVEHERVWRNVSALVGAGYITGDIPEAHILRVADYIRGEGSGASATPSDEDPFGSEKARELAGEQGLSADDIEGTGAGRNIKTADVRRTVASLREKKRIETDPEEQPEEQGSDEEEPDATPAARELAEQEGALLIDVPDADEDGKVGVDDVRAYLAESNEGE